MGADTGVTIAGTLPNGRQFVHQEFALRLLGRRTHYGRVGRLARPGFTHRDTPVESIEKKHPLRIVEYSIAPNTGGSGNTGVEWRSGAVTNSWEPIAQSSRCGLIGNTFCPTDYGWQARVPLGECHESGNTGGARMARQGEHPDGSQ